MKVRKLVLHASILLAILFISFGSSQAQTSTSLPTTLGWYQIPNTTLQAVCPPSTTSYNFSFYCQNVIAAWSGGVADTNRNRLIVWGGGHNDYYGNEVYALDLNNLTMTRLNNPSPIGQCVQSLSDGTANSRHTYNGLTYAPNVDSMYVYGGAPACPSGYFSNDTWLFNLGTLKWTSKDPNNASNTLAHNFDALAEYDPNTQKVILHDGSTLWQYDPNSNTYTSLNNAPIGNYVTQVIDPKRKKFVAIGNGEVDVFDITAGGSYALTHPTLSGCSGLVSTGYPGLAYDSAQDRIVGWTGGNSVYVLNMDTLSCTTVTYSGGPGAAQSNGTFGRFRYFPGLNVFALVNDWQQNAYVLRLTGGTGTQTVSVSVSPTTATVTSGSTQQFTASVSGSSNTAVTWSTTAGSISTSGLFTAPSVSSKTTVTVTATSQADTTKKASATVTVNPPGQTGGTGLVAAYSFDENTGTTVTDLSGNGNNGTISNATWTTGKFGSALNFNGSSSRVTIPDSASLDLSTGMTLEAWVKPNAALSGWQDVVYKGDDRYYLMGSSNTNVPDVGATSTTAHTNLYAKSALATGTWAHLAATFDGTTLNFYINGTLVASNTWSGTLSTSTNPLTIGSDSIYGQFFNGVIDEVRVYNRALSQTEVQTDMNTAVAGGSGTQPSVSVAVSPTTATLASGGTQQFTASVSGSTNTAVTWSASAGSISSTGLFTAPSVTSSTTVTVKATSQADTTKSATATVTVNSQTQQAVSVSVSPSTATVSSGGSQQFTASVSGTTNTAVTWSATAGSISSSGLFTAPSVTASTTVTVKATSQADTTKSSSATVTVNPTTTGTKPGLVAAYSFDENTGSTVNDLSGNGNNGTISNATWTTGKYGAALNFNGSSSRVTVPDSASLHLASGMTLEAWVKANATLSGWQDVVYKGNDRYYIMGSSNKNTPDAGATWTSGHTNIYATSPLTAGTWTHIAATYDGATLKLFINGTQVSSKAATGTFSSSTTPLTIGSDSIYGQYFNGVIDEVRVYNTALSAAQIQTDMNTPLGSSGTPTVSVAVSPTTATVTSGGTQQFTASVNGSTNTAVTWSASAGSISSTGLFTAPSVTSSTTVTVKAVSQADTTKSATATVTVNPATQQTVAVSVSPTTATLNSGNTQQFTATVTGSTNTAVTWTASAGTISSAGLFTAPTVTAATAVTVTATSQADTTKSATASVTVNPQTTATGSDYASRCSDPNVVRCFTFDSSSIMPQGDSSTSYTSIYPNESGLYECQLDTATKKSGAGSMRCDLPSNSGANASGGLHMNFKDDNSVKFGEGQEFYVQYAYKLTSDMLVPFRNANGWKTDLIGVGDYGSTIASSCSVLEVAVENSYQLGYPHMYHNCGSYQNFQFSIPNTSDYADQSGTGCAHYGNSGYTRTQDPPCAMFKAGEWMTIQVHIKVGHWNSPDSTIESWLCHQGQACRLMHAVTNYTLINDDTTNKKYGKIWLLDYNTGKDSTETRPVNSVWYDDLIISTRKIKDPDVATPNAPDLVLTAGGTGQVTVQWRRNSADETGFIVERCQGSIIQCVANDGNGLSPAFSAVKTLVSGTNYSVAQYGTVTWTDTGLTSGTTYSYRVRAYNASGQSGEAHSACWTSSTGDCGSESKVK